MGRLLANLEYSKVGKEGYMMVSDAQNLQTTQSHRMQATTCLFVHMPKCAGTGIKNWLAQNMADSVEFDYASYFKAPRLERNDIILEKMLHPSKIEGSSTIYGHFFPVKYCGSGYANNFKLITILRDPIDRICSHYRYWKSGVFSDHYLWRTMIEKDWSLEDFAFCDEMRSIYAQYFTSVPIGCFDYIGLFEDIEVSTARCLEMLGVQNATNVIIPKVNATQRDESLQLDKELLNELKKHHAEDYLIFEYAKAKFHQH